MTRIEFPIETERLLIRPMTVEDAEDLHTVYADPTTFEFMNVEPAASLDETRARIEWKVLHQANHGFALWAVVERAGGRVIGDCGLQRLEGGSEIEIGWKLARDVRGRGLATEAARACLIAGFDDLELDRIVAVSDPENVASRRVMKKLGMTLMGMGHHYGGETVLYAITRAEEAAAEAPGG